MRFALARAAGEEKGFAVRYDGAVRALSSTAARTWAPSSTGSRVSSSMRAGLYLVCSTHGALFEPATGFASRGRAAAPRSSRSKFVSKTAKFSF